MTDQHDLGPRLETSLLHACAGRLADIHWFRSDWQIGGAATAYAKFQVDQGPPRDVVVKFPIGPREHHVLTVLGDTDAPTPRIVAHGEDLGGQPVLWVVMERLPGTPLAAHRHAEVFPHLADAAAHFYKAGEGRLALDPPQDHDWQRLLERSREALRDNPSIPHASRWSEAVKHTARALPRLLTIWNGRAMNSCCHGDLHPGNCMERPTDSPWGGAGHILFDFAQAHSGHWVEDAVYMERLYWARPKVLNGMKPVSMLAQARRALGLDTGDDYATLADTRRALMASTAPAFLDTEGHPAYMSAALEILERSLAQLKL